MKNILIVEDERVVAMDLQKRLQSLGYEVPATAASADAALELAEKRTYDLVLMDVRIEGSLDGIETAALLRQRFDLPVVYLTAYADPSTVGRAKETEPHGYLMKPVRPDELRSAVELALYRHQAERRLRERERWFSTTLKSIGDAVISTDPKGSVTFMNPEAERLTGWRAEAASGRPIAEVLLLLDERTGHPLDNPIEPVLREKKSFELAGTLNGRDGRRSIADSAAPVIDERGGMFGAVVVFRDVTEERRLQRIAEEAARLRSLGTLSAGVAHQINNPLSVVMSNLQFALERLEGIDPETADALTDALDGAQKAAHVVSELRAFTRVDVAGHGSGDLKRAIEWALKMCEPDLQKVARVELDLLELPPIDADELRLGQVFMNLLVNSVQAFDLARKTENVVRIATRLEGDFVVTELRDNGAGMTEEVRRRALEPFFTTRAVGTGAGLGLSVCHGIVTSLGGTLALESNPGQGTVVRVALPKALPSRTLATAPGSRRPRALLIDDEELLRRAVNRMLATHCDVTVPTTATQALELIQAGHRYDIILCDLMMPDLTGMALYAQLMAIAPDQARRILFLTGGAASEEAERFVGSVPNRFMQKTQINTELRGAVAEQLQRQGEVK